MQQLTSRYWTIGFALIGVFSFIQLSTRAQPDDASIDELIQSERDAINARDERIVNELKALEVKNDYPPDHWSHEWAGRYYCGDGLGMNVSIDIAPEAGATYTWYGCLGLYDANHGDIVEEFPGGVKLRLALDETKAEFDYMSSTLYFVSWGDLRYLVPEAQMLEVVNGYNDGGFGRRFFDIPKKHDDQEGPSLFGSDELSPPGRPKLPEKYARLIIENPLDCRITAFEKVRDGDPVTNGVQVTAWKIELDAGTDQGIYEGMTLTFDRGNTYGAIDLEDIGEHSCTGILKVFHSPDEKIDGPFVGYEFSFPGAKPVAEIGKDGASDLETVLVQGETFVMGNELKKRSRRFHKDEPRLEVTVSDFKIGKARITNTRFCEFLNSVTTELAVDVAEFYYSGTMGETGFPDIVYLPDKGVYAATEGEEAMPVNRVTWQGAVEFCQWLSQKTGKTYRLPTEAEWELAARRKAAELNMCQGVVGEWCVNRWVASPKAEDMTDTDAHLDDRSRERSIRGQRRWSKPPFIPFPLANNSMHGPSPWTRRHRQPHDIKGAAWYGFRVVEEIDE